MSSIASHADQLPPLPAEASVAEVHRRFLDHPKAEVLAVCAGGQVVGVVEREVALKAAQAGFGDSPIGALTLPDPLMVEVDTPAADVCRALLADREQHRDVFVVTQAG